MEKLIITVACDSRTSYPINHLCPPQEDIEGVARQYIDGISAGAAIAHIHGIRTLEETMQADGRQVSRMNQEGWKRLNDAILSKSSPVMQFGVASARIEEKVKLMGLGPDMMAVAFNAHDEYFQPVPSLPPKRRSGLPCRRRSSTHWGRSTKRTWGGRRSTGAASPCRPRDRRARW